MNGSSHVKRELKKGRLFFRYFLPGLIVLSFLFYVFVLRGFFEQMKRNHEIEIARDLGLCLFAYANDNNGKYPEGKNSTEIFQKLLDGNYLSNDEGGKPLDLACLYYPIPGKIQALPGTKVLKSENVCWDVTCCANTGSSDQLPILFLTGYRITYQSGASAVPLPHPLRTWVDWWEGKEYPTNFIAVNYKGNNSMVIKAVPDGSIPHVVPTDFDSRGQVYHQLTPDGELLP